MVEDTAHLVVAWRIVGGEHRAFHGETDAGGAGGVCQGGGERQSGAGFLRAEEHWVGVDGADFRQAGD